MDRHGINLAIEHIDRHSRDARRRDPLITELTALDWQLRSLDDGQPVDNNLLTQISRLRIQIWLSSEPSGPANHPGARIRG